MPITGLRERKKLERREEILRCSRLLFTRDGFDGTTIEAIAAEVDVAVGTIYKFFPTKIDMLCAQLKQDLEAYLLCQPPITVDTHPDPQNGIQCLLEQQFRAMENLSKSALTRIISHALSTGQATETGRVYARTNEDFRCAIESLLGAYQARGGLSQGIDGKTLSSLIFSMADGVQLAWFTGELSGLKQSLDRQAEFLTLIFAGAAALAGSKK
jgi:AcrR family transcriptional regulator